MFGNLSIIQRILHPTLKVRLILLLLINKFKKIHSLLQICSRISDFSNKLLNIQDSLIRNIKPSLI
jgi:hypothetical protein